MDIKLASYNIHSCIGMDRLFDPYRIVEVIRELDADIIALQEVEHHLVNNIDLLDFIAQQTGMTAMAGPTMYRGSRHYGNAVLSRHAYESHELIDLSLKAYEPRGAIQFRLTINGHKLLVIATHLGLKLSERRHQVDRLLGILKNNSADSMILMGDLNEWFPWSPTFRSLKDYFGRIKSASSFPTFFPIFSLDRICVYPSKSLSSLSVHKSKLAKKASDHLPVIARLSI